MCSVSNPLRPTAELSRSGFVGPLCKNDSLRATCQIRCAKSTPETHALHHITSPSPLLGSAQHKRGWMRRAAAHTRCERPAPTEEALHCKPEHEAYLQVPHLNE